MSNTLRAAFWMIGSIVSFTLMAVAGREVSATLDTFEIMFFRSLTGIVIMVTLVTATGAWGQITLTRWKLHSLRNLAHFTGQNLWFYAITVLPLAQVFAFEFTTPIWVILLAPLLLGERITCIGVLAALFGFVGVLIVARPDPAAISPGIIAAASCAVAFALTAILTRKLTRTETITTILMFLTATQLVFGLVCAGYDGQMTAPTGAAVFWVILIGCVGLLAHFCLTKALSLAPANVVMPIDFARLPTIAIVGMLMYKEALDIWVFVGAFIIFGANYMNITLQNRATLRSA
ncbi:drug/metabolite transporter (DMT)-like permease [Loktanella ponticola]|uniref:Drug/metabolite transporter (DMT)-like permease n=1 Tax=Yoonia ponticola TaxID=1524255 RepID=A0A7W9BK16_9RHOB|nr:DMT family transporter [Yoonia ponticola]MBB5721905.1 drug/metabolite transporter (DMT)-like permease [Yoonia ponticola]